jgi:hypothetical protein
VKLFSAAIGIEFIRGDFPENDAWCRSEDVLKRRGKEHSTSRTFPKTVGNGNVCRATVASSEAHRSCVR